MIDENTVNSLIEAKLGSAQYNVAKTSFHTHNGIDSPSLSPSAIAGLYARMFIASPQSVNSSTESTIDFDSSSFENGITADTTNKQFVIKTAGIYVVHAQILWTASEVSLYQIKIIKGSSTAIAYGNFVPGAPISQTSIVTTIVSLAINDTIHANAYNGGSSPNTINISGSEFFIYKL
jgi:hypothetical protein